MKTEWFTNDNKKLTQCEFCRCLIFDYDNHTCKEKEELK